MRNLPVMYRSIQDFSENYCSSKNSCVFINCHVWKIICSKAIIVDELWGAVTELQENDGVKCYWT